jgi:hypothetical protein
MGAAVAWLEKCYTGYMMLWTDVITIRNRSNTSHHRQSVDGENDIDYEIQRTKITFQKRLLQPIESPQI